MATSEWQSCLVSMRKHPIANSTSTNWDEILKKASFGKLATGLSLNRQEVPGVETQILLVRNGGYTEVQL